MRVSLHLTSNPPPPDCYPSASNPPTCLLPASPSPSLVRISLHRLWITHITLLTLHHPPTCMDTLQNVKQTVKPELRSEKKLPVTTYTTRAARTEGSQAANELLLDIYIDIRWSRVDSDWTRRASVVSREPPLHESRSDYCVLLSHISGGHWRFEPARRNCHFISAGNGARKWNGLLFLVPLSVFYVCVRECCDFMSVGSWIQSQGCFLVLNIPSHGFPVRHRTTGTTLMQIQ